MDKPINKFRILLDFERGDIKLTEATETLGARTASDVLKSLTAYREHLPYLIAMSDRLSVQHEKASDRTALLAEIAERLGVTLRQVNRLMRNTNIITPSPYQAMMRKFRAEEAKEKWRVRFDCALSVIAGLDKMDTAAEIAEVSSRQMYRWVNKLLDTQFIKLKEVRQLQMYRRKEIADQIEQTQGEHFELHINTGGNRATGKPAAE